MIDMPSVRHETLMAHLYRKYLKSEGARKLTKDEMDALSRHLLEEDMEHKQQMLEVCTQGCAYGPTCFGSIGEVDSYIPHSYAP